MPEFDFTDDAEAGSKPALDEIRLTPDGALASHTVVVLDSLDAPAFGAAITTLVGQTYPLPTDARSHASRAIEGLLIDARSARRPVELDIAGLIAAYRETSVSSGRRDVADLVVRLLVDVDRDAIYAVIPRNAAGMDLWARLSIALDGASGVGAEQPEPDTTRTIDFGSGAGHAALPENEPEPVWEAEANGGGETAEANGGGETAEANGGGETAESTRGGLFAARGTYRAYGLLDCDEIVSVGESFPLTFGLSRTQATGVAGAPIEVPLPVDNPYDLEVQLFADGFDMEPGGTWQHVLKVSKDDLFPTHVVNLTPRGLMDRSAERTISATFSIGGETLGVAIRHVRVTTDRAAVVDDFQPIGTASGANITAPTGEPKAHVTISITRGAGEGILQWGIVSDLPGVGLPKDRPTTNDIGKDPKAFLLEIINELLLQGSEPGLFQILEGIGVTVHDEVPAAVQQALTAANEAVKPEKLQVLILTEEPFVPWELAALDAPFDPNAPNFLGAQANVGRWILDPDHPTDPPRGKSAGSMAVVWGVYKRGRLKAAEEEAELLQAEFAAQSVLAEPQPVTTLLDGTPAVDILHFAVHGKYAPQVVGDGIQLVSGPPVSPLRIRGAKLKERAPFVFLNACQVGASNTLLGNYGGMAQSFLRAGASGVVAPLWSIDDTIAKQIAIEFYRQALSGAPDVKPPASGAAQTPPPPVADILRQARERLYVNAKDMSATYLAYQFYGHPTMRLSWG